MASHAIRPDDELIATRLIRASLASTEWSTALVSNRLTKRPDGAEVAPDEDFAVIVRSDGGSSMELPTFSCRLGIRVIGPDGDDNHMRTGALARRVSAALSAAAELTTEVANTVATFGPYRVETELSRPECYLTAELVLVGAPITL